MTPLTMAYEKLKLCELGFDNPRTSSGLEAGELRELALHIGRSGLMNGLIVRSSGLILAGQRRFHAIGLLLRWRETLTDEIELSEWTLFDARAAQLRDVPVRIDDATDADAVALSDNLQRADLSSYETAAALASMAETRNQSTIARQVGKSQAWVSRHLTAWRQTVAEVKPPWRAGLLTFDQVQRLATLPPEKQRAELASGSAPKGLRNASGRPGIENLKEGRRLIERRWPSYSEENDRIYAGAALDALRWATGEPTSARFAALLEDSDA